MDSAKRRKMILEQLKQNNEPISATYLSKIFSVSRQIIVGDIALLRAGGENISSTQKGYILQNNVDPKIHFTVNCKHSSDDFKAELYTIIDNGGTIEDVAVSHDLYGEFMGKLNISSRFDADGFVQKVINKEITLLSELTNGVHFHSISCKTLDEKNRIIEGLGEIGVLHIKE